MWPEGRKDENTARLRPARTPAVKSRMEGGRGPAEAGPACLLPLSTRQAPAV